MKTKNKEVYFSLAGLIGLILVIIAATTLTPSSVYESYLSLNPSAAKCESLDITSVPSPLKSGKGAFIIIKVKPAGWQGLIRVSATDGILQDGLGNEGSIIETAESIVSYGGGAENETITAQAAGEGNEGCLGTLRITKSEIAACAAVKVHTDPAPLSGNQSAVIRLETTPADYSGAFLFESDSGIFRLTSADPGALGENTGTIVTSNKSVIYNGGKTGEKIRVTTLGENNSGCKETLEILP